MLLQTSPNPIHPSLAVTEPLVPPASGFTSKIQSARLYDSDGYSKYGRIINALLQLFTEDRQLAKRNLWALRHFLALSLYAEDFQSIPSADSPVFEAKALPNITDLITRAQQVVTYLLKSTSEDGWSQAVVSALITNKPNPKAEGLSQFLADLINIACAGDSIRESRILCNVLQHVLDDVDKPEAGQWIALARQIEKKGSFTFRVDWALC